MVTTVQVDEDTCNFEDIEVGSFFVYKHSNGRSEVCLKMHMFQYNSTSASAYAPANASAAESGESYMFEDDYKVRPVKEARFKC